MSLHTIYANPQYYQPTGMWQTMLDSLQGVEAKWPGGFPKNERDYSKLIAKNKKMASDRDEMVLVALIDEKSIGASDLAKHLGISDSGARHALQRLHDNGLATYRMFDNKRYWSINESPRPAIGITSNVSANQLQGRDGGML